MANTTIGLMLIDAPHSALNNAGAEPGRNAENAVVVKTIRKQWNKVYPYVSPQATRFWWRETLEQRYGWRVSPIERDKKTAFTKADPITYPDDDLFGYMRAEKGEPLTRVSPFKCSPLIAVTPQEPTTDFGVMSRQEDHPVPYEHQFYSVTLKGVFALDLDSAGRFVAKKRSGFHNISAAGVKLAEEAGLTVRDGEVMLSAEERGERASQWLSVLPYLAGGAKQAGHLTDVSPAFIILTSLSCSNHILMNVVSDVGGETGLNLQALAQALTDYREDVIAPVWIGRRAGFHDEWAEDIATFVQTGVQGLDLRVGSVKAVVNECADWLRAFYLAH